MKNKRIGINISMIVIMAGLLALTMDFNGCSSSEKEEIPFNLASEEAFAPMHAEGVVLSGFGTPTIDGVLMSGEWDSAGSIDFLVNTPHDGVTDGTLFVMNDEENLYIAIWFDYADTGNTAEIRFDNDHDDSVIEVGDDVILINPNVVFLAWYGKDEFVNIGRRGGIDEKIEAVSDWRD